MPRDILRWAGIPQAWQSSRTADTGTLNRTCSSCGKTRPSSSAQRRPRSGPICVSGARGVG
eukprot:1020381-Pyramimonas_sp.AAC.1